MTNRVGQSIALLSMITLISCNDNSNEQILAGLTRNTGKKVVLCGKAAGRRLQPVKIDVPLTKALDLIVAAHPDWLWYSPEQSPGTYEIWDQESFRKEVLVICAKQKVFVLHKIPTEEAQRAIQGLLTPNYGSAAFDNRSKKLFVTDFPLVISKVEKLVGQLDELTTTGTGD